MCMTVVGRTKFAAHLSKVFSFVLTFALVIAMIPVATAQADTVTADEDGREFTYGYKSSIYVAYDADGQMLGMATSLANAKSNNADWAYVLTFSEQATSSYLPTAIQNCFSKAVTITSFNVNTSYEDLYIEKLTFPAMVDGTVVNGSTSYEIYVPVFGLGVPADLTSSSGGSLYWEYYHEYIGTYDFSEMKYLKYVVSIFTPLHCYVDTYNTYGVAIDMSRVLLPEDVSYMIPICCFAYNYTMKSFTFTATIPSGVKKRAFTHCINLEELIIKSFDVNDYYSQDDEGNTTFTAMIDTTEAVSYCSSLKTVYVCGECESWEQLFATETDENGNTTLVGGTENLEGVTLLSHTQLAQQSECGSVVTCPACNETFASDSYKTEHSYESAVTTAATCTVAGVDTYTCKYCSDSYEVATEATGHNYVTTAATAATCTSKGATLKVACQDCGDVLIASEYIDCIEHTYASEVTKAATCTEAGTMTYTCTACTASYTETIAATGHSYAVTKAYQAATTEAAGNTAEIACSCGDILLASTEIAQLNPVLADQDITVATTYKALKVKKVKKKAQTFSLGAKASSTLSYKKISGKSCLSISSAGKVTVKKGTKKGTYTMKVKVSAAATSAYAAASSTVTITVVVK